MRCTAVQKTKALHFASYEGRRHFQHTMTIAGFDSAVRIARTSLQGQSGFQAQRRSLIAFPAEVPLESGEKYGASLMCLFL